MRRSGTSVHSCSSGPACRGSPTRGYLAFTPAVDCVVIDYTASYNVATDRLCLPLIASARLAYVYVCLDPLPRGNTH